MKSRYKILLVSIIIGSFVLIFVNLPTIHKQPLCDEGYVSIAGDCILNYDLLSILIGMIQERSDYRYVELDTCEEGYKLEHDECKPVRTISTGIGLDCKEGDIKMPYKCVSLTDVIFGNARKSWTVYPGGVGWILPQNSSLTRIYQEGILGMPSLNFTAMLDDKIFVDKCESNDGVWNYTYHDCEGIWEICKDVGGIPISRDISKPCTSGVCLDRKVYRISCVFEYEN